MRTTTPSTEIPKRQTKRSAGYDFYMPCDLNMEPGIWYTIDTKVIFEGDERPYFDACIRIGDELKETRIYPKQWVMNLAPRSSLGNKYGFKLANTIGIIDQDYVGHHITAKVSVDQPLSLKKGERFMQGEILANCYLEDEDVPDADRVGGHGSTDVKNECPPKSDDDKSDKTESDTDTDTDIPHLDPTFVLPLIAVAGTVANTLYQSIKTGDAPTDLSALLKAVLTDTKP